MADPLGGLIPATPAPELPAVEPSPAPVLPEQADVQSFNLRAGEFRKGLRMGANLSAATVAATAGAVGSAMGNEDFAAERMIDAKRFVDFGSAVGPRIRDYRAVKDLRDATDFAAGLVGQGVAFMAPAVVGATVGRRFGLRGSIAGAAVPSLAMETGESVLDTQRAPGTLGEKLPVNLAKGAAAAALDVAVPVAGVSRLARTARRGVPKGGLGLLTGTAGEAATEAVQEKFGQIAQDALLPGRDTSEDTPAMINAALQGAAGGMAFGGVVGLAAKAGGAVTPEQFAQGSGERSRVPDPNDFSDVPANKDEIPAYIDAKDAVADVVLSREVAQSPRKWANYQGWETDPAVKEQFIQAVNEDYAATVEAPVAKERVAGLEQAVNDIAGPKQSLVRTKLDLAIHDSVSPLMKPEVVQHLTPAERLGAVDALKRWVLHGYGENSKAGSVPIPKEFPQIWGENLPKVLQSTYDALKSGQPMRKMPNFRKALQRAAADERNLVQPLEETVIANLRPEYVVDATTRVQAARFAIDRLSKMLDAPGGPNWTAVNPVAEELFGPRAEETLQALHEHQQRTTGQYQTLLDNPDQTGEVLPQEPGAEASPYLDRRLGRPLAEEQLPAALRDLRETYDPKAVRFRVVPEVENGALTGRQTIVAEDAQAPGSFNEAEIQKISEKHGKAGLENGVLSIVRQDPRNPGRNVTTAISIPNLVAETARTFQFEGSKRGRTYRQALVLEALSRLVSAPETIRLSKRSDVEGYNFPDDMPVMRVGKNRRIVTWGEIKPATATRLGLEASRTSENAVERAQAAPTVEGVEEQRAVLVGASARYLQLAERASVPEAKRGFEQAATTVQDGLDRVDAEVERRRQEGDAPIGETQGIADVQGEIIPRQEAQIARTPRVFQEETGLPLRGAPRVQGGPTGALETGVRAEEKAPSTPMVMFSPEPGAAPVQLHKLGEGQFAFEGGTVVYPTAAEARRAIRARYEAKRKVGKMSEVGTGVEPITPEQEAEVRAYIEKVMGPKARVTIDALNKIAGEFSRGTNGAEIFAFSMHMVDPMSVAAHEAAHGLFARLRASDPRAYNILSNAANSPTMTARLRALLEGEEAALAQLSNTEERAAYMYQFWTQGALQVGPQTKTFFEKVYNTVRKVFHAITGGGEDVATLEQAEQLMRAFHEGELSSRATLARAVADIIGPRQDDVTGKLADWADRVTSTADGYVRAFKIPAVTAIADKFYNPDGKSGFVQTKHIRRNKFLTQYALATRGLSTAQINEVMAGMRRGEDAGAAGAGLRRLFDDLHAYMGEKGVKVVVWNDEKKKYEEHTLRKVAGYVPRVYDKQYIEANMDQFVAMLNEHGVTDANTVARSILNQEHAAPGESDFSSGLTFFTPAALERKLKIPDSALEPFLMKDAQSTVYSYINSVVRRGEYASRFGNRGQEIKSAIAQAEREGATTEQLKGFAGYVQAMEGTVGGNIDPRLRGLMSGVQTYQNFRLLPLALFSSLVDPNGIALRSGEWSDAPKAFARGVRELVSTKNDEKREFALLVGAINNATDEHMVADMYGATDAAQWQKWLNRKLFQLNGMESWNNSMRVHAASAAKRFIIKHATNPNEHSARYLRELGLEASDTRVVDGDLELTPAIVDAINHWVDGAVLRPHAAHRPIWMSDPHFMLIAHLKQFTYSFQKTIVSRTFHEAYHGNYKPLMIMMSYVPFIIASDMLRAVLTPGDMDDSRWDRWGAGDWMYHGVKRAGILGPGEYGLNVGEGHVTDLLGPTAQQMVDLVGSVGSQDKFSRQLLRAVPPVPVLSLK